MIGLSEANTVLVIVAGIGALGSLGAAALSQLNRKQLRTRNGKTLGQTADDALTIVQRSHSQLGSLTRHVGIVEAKLDTHLEQTAPLVEVFLDEHPDLRKGQG